MESAFCEVIGCGKPTEWVLVQRRNAFSEDYLCADCRSRLKKRNPMLAGCYLPHAELESLPGQAFQALCAALRSDSQEEADNRHLCVFCPLQAVCPEH